MIDKTKSLIPAVLQVVEHKGTEHPSTGVYNEWDKAGSYLCRRCGLALFTSQDKFHSGCGWPSFDEGLPQTVLEKPDSDGILEQPDCCLINQQILIDFIVASVSSGTNNVPDEMKCRIIQGFRRIQIFIVGTIPIINNMCLLLQSEL